MNTQTNGQLKGLQMRMTEEDKRLIRATFNNDQLLTLLRKIFLPELDPNVEIGQMIDLWLTVPIKDMTPDLAYLNLLARNQLISHVDNQLMTLKLIASEEEKTPEQVTAKVKANSSK